MEGNFTRVASYAQEHDTWVIKSVLENEGIEHYFKNENIVASDPLLSNAVGGIDLMVKAEDAERTLALINSIEEAPLENTQEDAEYDAWVKENRQNEEQKAKRTNTVLAIFVVLIIAAISLLFVIS